MSWTKIDPSGPRDRFRNRRKRVTWRVTRGGMGWGTLGDVLLFDLIGRWESSKGVAYSAAARGMQLLHSTSIRACWGCFETCPR